MTRWRNRTPRITRVTRYTGRPVWRSAHDERLDTLAAAVADVAQQVEAHNTHLGHVHATAIADTLESNMERRELSTRVDKVANTLVVLDSAVHRLGHNMAAAEGARGTRFTNLVDVVADLVVKVEALACREGESA